MSSPHTFVLKKKETVPDSVTANLPTVGVRIIPHPVVSAVLAGLNNPIISTSANLANEPAPNCFEDISLEADLAINSGRCYKSVPSTVVDVRSGEVLRSF